MAWAEVASSKASYYNAATATTAAVTLGAAVASGDLLWCAVSYSRATVGYVSSIATTGVTSGSWTLRGLEEVLPGDDQVLGLWAAVATSAGTPTITATFVATRTERSLYAGAFTGNDAAGTADGGTGEYDATTNHPSVTFSTAYDGDLLVGVSINNNTASAVAGSGFSTVTTNGGLYPIAFEWKEQTTASGSTVVDFTSVSGTPGFVIIGAAFKSGAALEQEGFRWYEDNGSESAASAAAAQDANITAAAGATKRLRMLINATGDAPTKQYKLQWKKSGGSWADVL